MKPRACVKGGLEGLKALRYWPQIVRKYAIPVHDASMVNLLYMAIYGKPSTKDVAFAVLTDSPRTIGLLPGVSASDPQSSLCRSASEFASA